MKNNTATEATLNNTFFIAASFKRWNRGFFDQISVCPAFSLQTREP
jgi:hypothetical protein